MLKAMGVGVLVSVVLTAVWTVGSQSAQLSWKMGQPRSQDVARRAAQVSDVQGVIVALIHFTIGFVWMMRRSPRTTYSLNG